MTKAYLTLENGIIFEGMSFGAANDTTGEIVFTTGMTGYLETLTDQSYYGQIIMQTFPLIGNYGVIPPDFEFKDIRAKGYIAKYPCNNPSNFRSEGSLDILLKERGIVGISGIDTRMLTKIIREQGSMGGRISLSPPTENDLKQAKEYKISDAIASVSTQKISTLSQGKYKVALLDFGAKGGIAKELSARECAITAFPHDTKAEDIIKFAPNGIMLSNGPGDPADPANIAIVLTLKELVKTNIPIFGICMGHQLLALAHGYKTRRLKFGHRGANQPVKEIKTGRVFITSQNHGYEVVAYDNSSFINVNDRSCEGLDYNDRIFSVQFHPEARGGPLDTGFLFDRFVELIARHA